MNLRRVWASIALGLALLTMPLTAVVEVYFSPDDHPTKRLIELIQQAKTRIHAAVYMLTDKRIATELIAAKQRNVDVQIIIDKISMDSSYGKGKMLQEAGIPIYVYYPKIVGQASKDSKFYITSIMHNKFALFDETRLWTGSFNWTQSADRLNHENVIITDDAAVRARFESAFTRLKNICVSEEQARGETERGWSIASLARSLLEFIKAPANGG